jgi:hypothetical protein
MEVILELVKALLSTEVTEFGISMEVKLLPLNI